MARRLIHYYHLFVPAGAEDLASQIWQEHVRGLAASGLGRLLDRMDISLVGGTIDMPPPPCPHVVSRFPGGFEMLTLERLRQDAATASPDTLYLYGHSKGVTHGSGTTEAMLNRVWRQAMLAHTVHGWQDTLRPLVDSRHDVSGGFYLEPPRWKEVHSGFGDTPYFAGNFWWATAAHLGRLPQLPLAGDRYDAEIWIGLAPHRAFSRTRNIWPSISRCRWACGMHAARRWWTPSWTP